MKQNALNRLIHSLSGSEKRQISLSGKRYSDKSTSRVMKLFKFYCNKPNADDEMLMNALNYDQRSVLATDKNYLYNFILKSIRESGQDLNVDLQLIGELQSIQYLRDKGLHMDAYKKLKACLKKSEKGELFEVQFLLMREYRRLFYRVHEKNDWPVERIKFQKKIQDITEKFNDVYWYIDHLMEINDTKLIQGNTRRQDTLDRIREMLDHPRMHDDAPLSTPAKYHYHSFARTAHDLLGDFKMEIYHSEASARLCLDKKSMIADPLFQIVNLCLYCDTAADRFEGDVMPADPLYAECKKTIEEWARKNKRPSVLAIRYYTLYLTSDIKISFKTNDLEALLSSTEKAMAVARKFPQALTEQSNSTLLQYLGFSFFIQGQFDKSLSYFSKIRSERLKSHRNDVFHSSIIMELVNHFEQGNKKFVASRSPAALRYFRERVSPYKSEICCLKYLKKLSEEPDIEGYDHPTWIEFANELESIYHDPEEQVFFRGFNLLKHWLHPRLQGLDKEGVNKEMLRQN
jgi:hypothetical protein